MELRTPMGRVRGLGGTSEGPSHWIAQRISAVALVPLSIWFVISALGLIGADYVAFKAWAGDHGNALLLVLLTVAMFQHAYLGVQVVIEDYVHTESVKVISLLIARFVAIACAVSCILAVARYTFGG